MNDKHRFKILITFVTYITKVTFVTFLTFIIRFKNSLNRVEIELGVFLLPRGL